VPDGALRATLPHSTTAAFAPDGTAITAGDGKVRFWSTDGRELASVDCPYPADRLVLDPSGRWLFVRGTTAGDVLVIDVASRTARARLPVRNPDVSGIARRLEGLIKQSVEARASLEAALKAEAESHLARIRGMAAELAAQVSG